MVAAAMAAALGDSSGARLPERCCTLVGDESAVVVAGAAVSQSPDAPGVDRMGDEKSSVLLAKRWRRRGDSTSFHLACTRSASSGGGVPRACWLLERRVCGARPRFEGCPPSGEVNLDFDADAPIVAWLHRFVVLTLRRRGMSTRTLDFESGAPCPTPLAVGGCRFRCIGARLP